MTNQRLKELQTEIAKLKELDNKISERVAAEFDAMDAKETEVPCSLEQDMEWANESENIQ